MDRKKRLTVFVFLGLILVIVVLIVIYLVVLPELGCSLYSAAPLARFTFKVIEVKVEPENQEALVVQIQYSPRICERGGFSFTMGPGGLYKSWDVTTAKGGLRVKKWVEYRGNIECFMWIEDKWEGMGGIDHFNFIGDDDGTVEVSVDCRSWHWLTK